MQYVRLQSAAVSAAAAPPVVDASWRTVTRASRATRRGRSAVKSSPASICSTRRLRSADSESPWRVAAAVKCSFRSALTHPMSSFSFTILGRSTLRPGIVPLACVVLMCLPDAVASDTISGPAGAEKLCALGAKGRRFCAAPRRYSGAGSSCAPSVLERPRRLVSRSNRPDPSRSHPMNDLDLKNLTQMRSGEVGNVKRDDGIGLGDHRCHHNMTIFHINGVKN
jgi:hypothetical protein